jgi:hypothetical protein
MPSGLRLVSIALLGAAIALGLTGCAAVNEKITAGAADYVPQWAGGLPADAPPRPGTPAYDAFMRERERRRQLPAAEREKLPPIGAETTQGAPPQ